MQRSQPESSPGQCVCGRSLDSAVSGLMRSRRGVFRFIRCACGLERTERISELDLSQPIALDEVLDVHRLLAGWEGSLDQLTASSPPPQR